MAKAKKSPIDNSEFLQSENNNLRKKLDRVENERDNALRILTNCANLLGYQLKTYQPECLSIVRAACRQHPKLIKFAKEHEAWEAKMLNNDEYWGPDGTTLSPLKTDELYDQLIEIQKLRNEALEE